MMLCKILQKLSSPGSPVPNALLVDLLMKSLRLRRSAINQAYVCQNCRLAYYGLRTFSRNSAAVAAPTDERKRRTKTEDAEKPVVRWFEQRAPGKSITRAENPEEADAKDLKSRIDRLEGELQEMRGGVFKIPQLLSKIAKEGRANSSELHDSSIDKDIELLEKLSKSLLSGNDVAADGSEDISRSTVKMVTRREQRIYLNRLNGYLKQAEALGVDPATRKQLWRWYNRCKQNIPTFCSQLSDQTFTTMWESQSTLSSSNPDRSAHLKTIAEDILGSGRPLTLAQRVAYIEALFLEGEHVRAVKEWRTSEPAYVLGEELAEPFFELGVMILALQGYVDEAHKIAYSMVNTGKAKDPRILIPVVRAWAKDGGNIALRRAWAAYIRLRELLGSGITMEDYDVVCKIFLNARRADLAIGVFKDMMLSDDPSSDQSSYALYRKALGTIADIRTLAYDSPEINKLSLEAMTVLPRKFQNKFFYGSWIKRLLGAGDVDSAALVVELMGKRGVRPDAKYLNGIIGAWIRQGQAEAYEKAEQMAWQMIEARKAFAWKRRAMKRGQDMLTMSNEDLAGSGTDSFGVKTPATVETFNILIEHYLQRQNHDQVRWLNRSIGLSEIEPDAFFVNCLLRSQLRTEGLRKVWQTYSEWVQSSHSAAKANMETFAFLWDCAQLRVDRTPSWRQEAINGKALDECQQEPRVLEEHESMDVREEKPPRASKNLVRKQTGFPSPRALFGNMLSWVHILTPKFYKLNQNEFGQDLYNRVVTCFVQDAGGDLVGALVAMYAMKEHFNRYPDEETAKILMRHIAKDEEYLRHQPGKDGSRGFMKVSERLAEVARRRMKLFEGRGIDLKKCDDHFRQEENLHLLSDLVRDVLARNKDLGELEHVVQRAAWDMDVGGIDTGDHLKRV